MADAPPAEARGDDSVISLGADVDLVVREGRTLLADSASGTAVELNDTAAATVERLAGPTTPALVVASLCSEFEVTAEECSAAVDRLVTELYERAMLDVHAGATAEVAQRRRYLDLLARALVNLIYPEHELLLERLERERPPENRVERQRMLRDLRYTDAEGFASLVAAKREGEIWRRRPVPDAHTMIGLRRLENLERCAVDVFAEGVEGDFLEAGVNQGGACVYLRALQIAYDEDDRCTWVADSFAGLPPPTDPRDVEAGQDYSESRQPWLATSEEAVRDTFRTYGLLSDAVRFVPGWFDASLAASGVERLAILRIDADLYSSTRDVLTALYDRVSDGGYVIVDDYAMFPPCRAAVDEFLAERGLRPTMRQADANAVFWRKTG